VEELCAETGQHQEAESAEPAASVDADLPIAVSVEELPDASNSEEGKIQAVDGNKRDATKGDKKAEEGKEPRITYPEGLWDLPVLLDNKVVIKNVYAFLNDPERTPTGSEKSLAYEFKYFNHGAVTEGQKKARKGYYYVVSWANRAAEENLVLRLDYRQVRSRDKVHVIEIPYSNARGSYKGRFSITGDAYCQGGPVISWRVSVVRDGKIVAQNKSFVW
jgi:hypothetical protein